MHMFLSFVSAGCLLIMPQHPQGWAPLPPGVGICGITYGREPPAGLHLGGTRLYLCYSICFALTSPDFILKRGGETFSGCVNAGLHVPHHVCVGVRGQP